jgi:hypothetical protein
MEGTIEVDRHGALPGSTGNLPQRDRGVDAYIVDDERQPAAGRIVSRLDSILKSSGTWLTGR